MTRRAVKRPHDTAGHGPHRRHRAGLSREEIATTALAYLDGHGLAALSMRRLAEELGVGTMTLYHHFPSKRALLDAVVDLAWSELSPPPLEGPWRDQLRHLVGAGRSTLIRHPVLVEIRSRQPMLQPEALRTSELGLRVLEQGGFEAEDAVRAYRLLFTYTFGFALFSPQSTEEEARRAARAAMASLPAEYIPRLSRAIDEASEAMSGDAVFEWGLERLLDGLEVMLPGKGRRTL